MSVSSFTNQVGEHVRHDIVTDYAWDFNLANGLGVVKYIAASGPVPFARSYKSPTIQGDFKRSFKYDRNVWKVTEDSPAIFRDQTQFGNPGEEYFPYWYEREIHLSGHLGTFWLDSHDFNSVESSNAINAFDESQTKALNDLAGKAVGIGASLAQGRKTIDEFSRLAITMANGLHAFRRKDFSWFKKLDLKTAQKTLADIWLQYSYGWKPLAGDLYAAQQGVHEILQNELFVVGIGRSHVNRKFSVHNDNFIRWPATIDLDGTVSAKTVLVAKVSNPYVVQLNSVGLLNPLSIAWELVPWSFAIDWFVPIGATLQAVTAGFGLESMGGQTGVTRRNKAAVTLDKTYPPGYYGTKAGFKSGGRYSVEGFDYNRYPLTSFPAPKIFADVTPYSTPRALNALALTRSLLR